MTFKTNPMMVKSSLANMGIEAAKVGIELPVSTDSINKDGISWDIMWITIARNNWPSQFLATQMGIPSERNQCLIWLVVSTNPAENYESVGIMKFPINMGKS
jgi:hypothetical protein